MATEKSEVKPRSRARPNAREDTPQLVPLTFRISAALHARLAKEADSRAEDLSSTARRRLSLGIAQDDLDSRLEKIERKLDAISSHAAGAADGTPAGLTDAVEAVANASVEMEGRLAEVLSRQKATQKDLEALRDAYQDIVKGLNAFIEKARR